MSKGELFVLEGPDGAGKSHLCKVMVDFFEKRGREVVVVRVPGATPVGEKLRAIVLDKDNNVTPLTAALLMTTSRADALTTVIKPALDKGKVVLVDRWCLSMYIYQQVQLLQDVSAYAKPAFKHDLQTMRKLTCLRVLSPTTILLDADDNVLDDRLEAGGRLADTFKAKGSTFLTNIRYQYRKAVELPWEYGINDIVRFNTSKNAFKSPEEPAEWVLSRGSNRALFEYLTSLK